MDDRKSPVTCMIIVNDYLWVGSHSGAKVYDAANRKTKGHWVTKIIVTAMILVPHYKHRVDKEALLMLTKSRTILVQWQRKVGARGAGAPPTSFCFLHLCGLHCVTVGE